MRRMARNRRSHADELLKKNKNLVCILGNHDYWALDWMLTGKREEIWLRQKRREQPFNLIPTRVPPAHIAPQKCGSGTCQNSRLFVHAGIDADPLHIRYSTIRHGTRDLATRPLISVSRSRNTTHIAGKICVGHTPFRSSDQFRRLLYLMDTSAGLDRCSPRWI